MLKVALIFMVALAVGGSATAQTASINNNLVFGDVFPGIPKKIDKKAAGAAAEFVIDGVAGNEVTVDFTLPTYLNDGGLHMQLVFQTTDCAIDSSATPDQSNPGLDDLNPWHTIIYNLGLNGLTVWLGGTVVPQLSQQPGNYSALIVLTVAYSGT